MCGAAGEVRRGQNPSSFGKVGSEKLGIGSRNLTRRVPASRGGGQRRRAFRRAFNVLSLVVVVRPLGRRPLDRKSNKNSIENYTEINDEINPK